MNATRRNSGIVNGWSRQVVRALVTGAAALAAPSAAMVGMAGLACSACAQVRNVDAYSVVVTEDSVNMRCGAGSVWYAVAQLAKGDVLRVDGTDDGWLRVAYPPGTAALVKNSEARLDAARGVVVLTKRSKLLAANVQGGVAESWRALLDNELPTGTELQSLGEVRDAAGGVAGYRVAAPEGAKGFVSEQFVRKATDAEVAAAKGVTSGAQQAAKPTPSGATTATPSTTQPSGAAQTAPPPVAQPTSAPATDAPATTTESPPAPAQPVEAPPPVVRAPDRRIAEFEALNAKYEAIKKVPVEQAEIEPLIAEYQRYIGSLTDGSGSSTRRAVAQGTVELLNARLDLKKAKLAAAQAVADAEKDWKSVAEQKAALDAKPRYTVVGRLSASTIYDGDRLPLMFRVLSVEGFPGRTLAYVTPAPGVDVSGRVGLLVGIMGEGNVDASLGVPVLRPSRVDPLTPGGAALPAGASTPPTDAKNPG